MLEINTVKTKIPIPRSALPTDVPLDKIGAAIVKADGSSDISMSKLLSITLEEGIIHSNYIYVDTASTFVNLSNNEPAYYNLMIFNKDDIYTLYFTLPLRWCGRVNAPVKNGVHTAGNTFLDVKQQYPTKYFEG